MAIIATKFEVRLPTDQGTDENGNISAQDTATRAFLASLLTIIPSYSDTAVNQTTTSGAISQYNAVYGLLTNAQASAALALLNTLNAALGFTVVCYVYNVTIQP